MQMNPVIFIKIIEQNLNNDYIDIFWDTRSSHPECMDMTKWNAHENRNDNIYIFEGLDRQELPVWIRSGIRTEPSDKSPGSPGHEGLVFRLIAINFP